MKTYDYELAKKIVDTFDSLNVLSSACLGMQEDWFWTAETIFENNLLIKELNEDTKIGGITGSSWATPVIKLELKSGEIEVFECFKGDWESDIDFRLQKTKDWVNGCMSVPAQIEFNKNEVKVFKNK